MANAAVVVHKARNSRLEQGTRRSDRSSGNRSQRQRLLGKQGAEARSHRPATIEELACAHYRPEMKTQFPASLVVDLKTPIGRVARAATGQLAILRHENP